MLKKMIEVAVYMIAGAVIAFAISSASNGDKVIEEKKAEFDKKMMGKQNIQIRLGEDMKHSLMQHHLHGSDGKIIWQEKKDTISLPVLPETEETDIEVPEVDVEDIRG